MSYMRDVNPIESRIITNLFKKINSAQIRFNEAIKSNDNNSYCLKTKSILKTSDISLSKLAEIDPDVIGNGSFRIFSKPINKK